GQKQKAIRLPDGLKSLKSKLLLHLDLNIDTAGKLKLHQSIDGLGAIAVDVNKALVGAKLKLLTRFLVNVRRTKHRKLLLFSGQRNRTAYYGAGSLHSSYDLLRRFIDEVVVVRLQFNSNLLVHTIAC